MKESSIDLRNFLFLLEHEGELVRVKRGVNAEYELAIITAKLDAKQAVLFETIDRSKIGMVASNIVATPRRFYLAIAGEPRHKANQADVRRDIHARVTKALNNLSEPAKGQGDAPFQKNSSNNLYDLPIVTHFEKDAGPFITSSIVFAKDQEKDKQNQSTHRLLRLADRHMTIRMVEGRHLHKCFTYACEPGEALKVTITIGVHPAVSIAAAYQAAYGVDEMLIANSLLDGKLTLSKTRYSQLYIPRHAEIVLEGRILRDSTHEEWMVEMLRTYDFKRKQPVFELDTIMFRDNAIYQDILHGYTEHRLLMGLPVEAKMYDS